MNYLDWASDGLPARCALALAAVVAVGLSYRSCRSVPLLRRLFVVACGWHLAVWAFYVFWVLPFYYEQNAADVYGYHHTAIGLASAVRDGQFDAIPWGLGTNAVIALTTLVYALTGGDIYGLALFSTVLGFSAALLFGKAFLSWEHHRCRTWYAAVMLFLPSLCLWQGLPGKDSWVALGLALMASGISDIFRTQSTSGIAQLVAGTVLAGAIRPHIALAVLLAAAGAPLLSAKRSHSAFKAAVLAIGVFALVAVGAPLALRFLGMQQVSVEALVDYQSRVAHNNDLGGSTVGMGSEPGGGYGALAEYPADLLRLLVRPFPWEAHNFNSALASAENLFIMICLLALGFGIRSSTLRRSPYLVFSLLAALALAVILAPLPNLGLLSRQRAQLLPFFFAFLFGAQGRGLARRPYPARRRILVSHEQRVVLPAR
jgi:hypothetical protein